ncbi:MAG: PQQ-dependent dehydrogenase, methanol/ethanol family [Acidobacteria bacterium]|nr:PQQ-dependent dehydrogenase, methanol/ethanol family [Acidobacteriota bacterium]
MRPLWPALALLAGASFSFLAGELAAQVRFEEILRPPAENWLSYSGDYSGRRHSQLKQINTANVGNVVSQWVYYIEGAKHLECTPIVVNGVMYVTNSNEVHALDARTGRRIWLYQDTRTARKDVNRGVAVLDHRVFFVTGDAHLVALHATTGALLWDVEYADVKRGYFATLAPLALKDKVIVGVSGGDSGMRGFVAAYSASTGEELWRFYTVPTTGEPGSESWDKFPLEWAGAATWMTGTYDPELNLLFWPTGNPWPDFYGGDRQGDNLYSDSVVALNAATGKLKWYFQFTPHDTHDWDAQEFSVALDADWRGKPRKLLIHANRNGFFYVLDRTNGQFLFGKPFVQKLNWAKGLNERGRPIVAPNTDPTPTGVEVCPSVRGASNWMSPSYNPETRLFYVPTLEQCDTYTSSSRKPEPMKNFGGTGAEPKPNQVGQFYMRALDPLTAEIRWEHPMPGPATMWTGTVSTAGGLVFAGDDDGHLIALDAKTGRDLWYFYTGQLLTASPITYMAGGKQYVAIATATSIFSFALFEPQTAPGRP